MRNTIIITNKISSSPSTVLVPENLAVNLKFIKKRFGSVRIFLKTIVHSDISFFRIKARACSAKIYYQHKELDLLRYNFRPFDADWERFRLLAMTSRISMTKLFVYCLENWELFVQNSGVPTKPITITLKQPQYHTSHYTYLEILRILS